MGMMGPAAKDAAPALKEATKDPLEEVATSAKDALKRVLPEK